MAGRPNVLWICADDYTPDACGAYGNRVVRTPNLSRLAAEGLRFDRGFAAAPLSSASRQAFFTGRYPRSTGVTLSRTPLPDDETTLPARLQAAGYETAAFGKTHFYAPRPSDYTVRVDRGEYTDWLSARDQLLVPADVPVLGPWAPFHDPARVWLNADVLPFGRFDEEMVGTFYATRAAEYLRSAATQPFFCYVSFYETHSPFGYPVDWPHRHSPDEFAAPRITRADKPFIPEVFRELTVADRRGITAAYHTCANYLDRNVGLVLNALDDAGLRDGTLVIFTSDHGYLLGQHGRFEKHCEYDPAVRTCLLIRRPGATAGSTTSTLVSLIDLYPTVLDYCGVPVPDGVFGRSLLPVLKGESDTHREFVIAEYCDNTEIMVRTKEWKWIYSAGVRRRRDGYAVPGPLPGVNTKLFNLHDDPDEVRDLSTKPRYASVRRELTDLLVDHVRATDRFPDRLPDTADADELLRVALLPPELHNRSHRP